MSQKFPISPAGRYVAPSAVAFADASGDVALVSTERPLPVLMIDADAVVSTPPPPPLSGTISTSTVAGPFEPLKALPMHLQLSGEWQGTVRLERSTDGGATRQGLTIGGSAWASFSANVNEPVWQESEASASFWLNLTLTGGTLTYRLSQ